jgi:hypothetical protein
MRLAAAFQPQLPRGEGELFWLVPGGHSQMLGLLHCSAQLHEPIMKRGAPQ